LAFFDRLWASIAATLFLSIRITAQFSCWQVPPLLLEAAFFQLAMLDPRGVSRVQDRGPFVADPLEVYW